MHQDRYDHDTKPGTQTIRCAEDEARSQRVLDSIDDNPAEHLALDRLADVAAM